MNKRQRKYFGLTCAQTAVLFVLSCLACMVVTGGIGYIGSLNLPPVADPIISTSLPTKTLPLSPSSTLVPTATLSPSPTLTLAATATLQLLTTSPLVPVATLVPSQSQSDNPLRFHFIDVGQGDSTLIQTPNGEIILIDGGETNTGVVQYLQSVGVQRIDLIIATHPHSDHIGGLVQVLQAFPVLKVITNGEAHTSSVYEKFLDAIANAQAEYIEVKRGDVIQMNGLNISVLNPSNNTYPDLNENSVVLQFTSGKTTFLLMGDAGADVESALLTSGLPLRADILKVGHHGSTSGSTPAFLNAVHPAIALYSAGIGNSYNHPSPQTITAFSNIGSVIYGTDKNGTIILTVGMDGYQIAAQKDSVLAVQPVLIPTNASASSGGLESISVTSPVSPGATATLSARAIPGASCSITVHTKSGTSSASGLEPHTADASGSVSWTWKVGARTTPGDWPIEVDCNGVIQKTSIKVQ